MRDDVQDSYTHQMIIARTVEAERWVVLDRGEVESGGCM